MSEDLKGFNKDLKECPLCGKEVHMHEFIQQQRIVIKCLSCNLKLSQRTVKFDMGWLKDTITKSWNRRWR